MKRTYKTATSSYVGYGIGAIGLSGLALFPLFLGISSRKPADLFVCCLIAGFPIFVFWWLSRFRLTISSDSISYSCAFAKEQSVDLAAIPHAEVTLIVERQGLFPRVFLAIKTPTEIKMRIHHKVFSHKAYQDLRRTVMPNTALEPTPTAP
jgi:hypothetical protein